MARKLDVAGKRKAVGDLSGPDRKKLAQKERSNAGHLLKAGNNSNSVGTGKNKCGECGQVFDNLKEISVHMQRHLADKVPQEKHSIVTLTHKPKDGSAPSRATIRQVSLPEVKWMSAIHIFINICLNGGRYIVSSSSHSEVLSVVQDPNYRNRVEVTIPLTAAESFLETALDQAQQILLKLIRPPPGGTLEVRKTESYKEGDTNRLVILEALEQVMHLTRFCMIHMWNLDQIFCSS